jgi:hypothetical protein
MRDAGRGLLGRRPVLAAGVRYIGKESNSLEDTKAGRIFDLDDVLNEYRGEDAEWPESVQWVLRQIPKVQLAEETGLSERTVAAARNGRPPHPRNRMLLIRAAGAHARGQLHASGLVAPMSDADACEIFHTHAGEGRSE